MPLVSRAILHIHPTRTCNLACKHCYSTSGPAERAALDVGELLAGTARFRAMGYEIASLSGGEPTVYPELDVLCDGLRDQGYRISVITNGLLGARAKALLDDSRADALSISFDGLAARHDGIRLRKGAFDAALRTLYACAGAGHRVGAVVAVTGGALPELPALTDLLVEAGAARVQFHPISAVGRADGQAGLEELGEIDLLRVFLLTQTLAEVHPEVDIRCDVLPRKALEARETPRPGGLISPLIVDSDGQILPFAHGIAPSWSLGRLGDQVDPRVGPQHAALIERLFRGLGSARASTLFSELGRFSHRLDPGAVVREPA